MADDAQGLHEKSGEASPGRGGWWTTLPGILAAVATVITAATGLLAILAQNGVFGERNKPLAVDAASIGGSVPKTDGGDKPAVAKASPAVPRGVSIDPVPVDGAATGVASAPLRSMPFTGAIVTKADGGVVKLRDEVREYCQGRPVLKTPDGQLIEMSRMARFDVVDWRGETGTVRITLNNGETVETRIQACAMVGTNDLGDYRGPFDGIRSVVFVR